MQVNEHHLMHSRLLTIMTVNNANQPVNTFRKWEYVPALVWPPTHSRLEPQATKV